MATAEQDITRMATKIANQRMREEMLPLLAQSQSADSLRGLRRSWAPFKVGSSKDEYGFKLNATDQLVVAIMSDEGLFGQTNQIGVESMTDAMAYSKEAGTFVQAALDGLRGLR